MKKDQNVIQITDLNAKAKHAEIYIDGDGDLILNKMNARTERMLLSEDRKKVKEKPNPYEDIITSMHWRDPLNISNSYEMCTKETLDKLLKENAPCVSAFGLKKSFCQAVVRNGIDTYATKFDVSLNIVANMGLIPITFATYTLEERLMSPQKGAPVNVKLNHFGGWKAHFEIAYFEHVYTLDEMVNIINLAGFGLGIGSGRSSGYGRYHVSDIKAL